MTQLFSSILFSFFSFFLSLFSFAEGTKRVHDNREKKRVDIQSCFPQEISLFNLYSSGENVVCPKKNNYYVFFTSPCTSIYYPPLSPAPPLVLFFLILSDLFGRSFSGDSSRQKGRSSKTTTARRRTGKEMQMNGRMNE